MHVSPSPPPWKLPNVTSSLIYIIISNLLYRWHLLLWDFFQSMSNEFCEPHIIPINFIGSILGKQSPLFVCISSSSSIANSLLIYIKFPSLHTHTHTLRLIGMITGHLSRWVLSGSIYIWTHRLDCYVVKWGSNNKHHKETCLVEIGVHLQILITNFA